MGKVLNPIKKFNFSCTICGKSAHSSRNKSHSMHKTNSVTRPNLQYFNGKIACTSCIRNFKK